MTIIGTPAMLCVRVPGPRGSRVEFIEDDTVATGSVSVLDVEGSM